MTLLSIAASVMKKVTVKNLFILIIILVGVITGSFPACSGYKPLTVDSARQLVIDHLEDRVSHPEEYGSSTDRLDPVALDHMRNMLYPVLKAVRQSMKNDLPEVWVVSANCKVPYMYQGSYIPVPEGGYASRDVLLIWNVFKYGSGRVEVGAAPPPNNDSQAYETWIIGKGGMDISAYDASGSGRREGF